MPVPQVGDPLQQVEATIREFTHLIDSAPRESAVQLFLQENPFLLSPDVSRVASQVKLPKGDNSFYAIDFVVHLGESQCILVEIEQPSHSLLTKGRDFTWIVNHALKQTEDWMDWISRHRDFANAEIDALASTDEISCWVVVGRKPTTRLEIQAIAARNLRLKDIRLMTYDDLIDRAWRQVGAMRAHAGRAPQPAGVS